MENLGATLDHAPTVALAELREAECGRSFVAEAVTDARDGGGVCIGVGGLLALAVQRFASPVAVVG